LQPLPRRFFACPHGHIDLLVGQLLFFSTRIAQAWCNSQAMLALKLLSHFNRAAGLPLAQPHFPVQPDTARDDVNVVFIGVLVTHGHPRCVLAEAHALHEVSRHGFPFLGTQALAGRQ